MSHYGPEAKLTGVHVVWVGAVEGLPGALDQRRALPVTSGARP